MRRVGRRLFIQLIQLHRKMYIYCSDYFWYFLALCIYTGV